MEALERPREVDVLTMTAAEILCFLESIDMKHHIIISVCTPGDLELWATGPFRFCFAGEGSDQMFLIAPSDQSPVFHPMQYVKWVAKNCADAENAWACVCSSEVSWSVLKNMLEWELDRQFRAASIPCSRAHPCWEMFNSFWKIYFSSNQFFLPRWQ